MGAIEEMQKALSYTSKSDTNKSDVKNALKILNDIITKDEDHVITMYAYLQRGVINSSMLILGSSDSMYESVIKDLSYVLENSENPKMISMARNSIEKAKNVMGY